MSVVSFCFESNPVRTLGDSLNPLFVALDICKALGFQDAVNAVKRHVDPEDLCKEEITDSLNRKQLVNCVNESGMYALIFGSKLPSAKRFKKWVTSEVLPTIRKTGQYQNRDNASRVATLTPAQQLLIQQAVGRRAQRTASHYQTIYRAIKLRFQIARYDQLPQFQLNECLAFIEQVDLTVPEPVQPEVKEIPDYKILSEHDCDQLIGFVYSFKYHHRRELELHYEFLKAAKSPYADKFYEMINDSSITSLERILNRSGFTVEDLASYHSWMANHR